MIFKLAGGWRFLRVLVVTGPRDLIGLIRLLKTTFYFRWCLRNNKTIPQLFAATARKYPEKICFVTEDRSWTFREVDEQTNRIANTFLQLGLRPGDEVVLFMDSRPEMVMMWLGLSKIGVVSALVNNNLKSQPLIHSMTCINTKAVIIGSAQTPAVEDIADTLLEQMPNGTRYFTYSNTECLKLSTVSLDPLLAVASVRPHNYPFKPSIHDKLVYIYTSGTTGLPKAAIIKHSRFISMCSIINNIMPLRSSDVLYTCLPLYHTAGGVVSVGQSLLFGHTLAIRPKFSASKFWDDCIRFNATVTQYIGEICRYLLATPSKPQERQHRIRMMFGNGLRPQIWEEFTRRFNIPNIREFYGSTEGNAHVMNFDNKVGAVGFSSRIAENVHPVRLIRVNDLTGEPLRNAKGLCIPCQPGEPGELVGVIRHNDHIHSFDGYVNEQATHKKIYRDVFSKGDAAFASGDLLVMDEWGYLYFRDRTGDTFRWKGENVSTSEVEGVACKVLQMADCVVYGVEVPGAEGRAGMAALLDPDCSIDLDVFAKKMREVLPVYAVPLFVRRLKKLQVTSTYKMKKVELQKEGFDINQISDPIYFLDLSQSKYVPVTPELYELISSGKARV